MTQTCDIKLKEQCFFEKKINVRSYGLLDIKQFKC